MLAETFYPQLETTMIKTIQTINGDTEQLRLLVLIAKIFFMSNTLKLLPFLVEAGRLENWV